MESSEKNYILKKKKNWKKLKEKFEQKSGQKKFRKNLGKRIFFEGEILISTKVRCWLGWVILFKITTIDLPMSLPGVKTFMILTYLNINPHLMTKMVVSNLSMWAEAHRLDTCQP